MIRALVFFWALSVSLGCHAETLLVIGDSISAGYGLGQVDQGWVALMRTPLKARGVEVVNASISGDTTQGGLDRIDALLDRVSPSIVIIELGGNDGLRGLTPAQMEHNLIAMIEKCRRAKARVVLVGMRMPPNYGKRYTGLFEDVYPRVAGRTGTVLLPFLLEGIGGNEALMQPDGIHPNDKAQPLMADRVLNVVRPLLASRP